MEQCLIDNKICSVRNQKCYECTLDDCRKALLILEEEEAMLAKTKEEQLREELKKELKKEYPECVDCRHLYILNIKKQKVYCPYRINGCILRSR